MKKNWLQDYLNMMDRGLMHIDENLTVDYMNRRCQEIIGLIHPTMVTHGGGKLEEGDFVFIVDYPVGGDDGNLTREDLKPLGIRDEGIKEGGALLVMAAYKDYHVEPVYRFIPRAYVENTHNLTMEWQGLQVNLMLDIRRKQMVIDVDQHHFPINFLQSYGHMMIYSSKDEEVKFVQAHGYTIRDEDLAHILRGGEYQEKDGGMTKLEHDGYELYDLVAEGSLTKKIEGIADKKCPNVENELFEINKRLVMGSIFYAEDDGGGVLLEFNEIQDINQLLRKQSPLLDQFYRDYDITEDEDDLERKDHHIIAKDDKVQQQWAMALKASKFDYPVLITGERGVGKSYLARGIHKSSDKSGKFIKLSLRGMKEEAMEIALFGYPDWGREGVLKEARGGTLYIHDIDLLPGYLQGALYQTLQRGNQEQHVEQPRLIAGTTESLGHMVEENRFLEDLYDWISVFTIQIPPLREREEDWTSFICYFLEKAAEKERLPNGGLSDDALLKLNEYHWPENVKELERVLTQALIMSDGKEITPEDIVFPQTYRSLTLKERLAIKEKEILQSEMEFYRGDKKKVMDRLDISKTALYDKLNKYDL